MKVHAYKSDRVVELRPFSMDVYKSVMIYALCGGVTPLLHIEGEDIPKSICAKRIKMYTYEPDNVTCGSCRRSKRFALFHLRSIEL